MVARYPGGTDPRLAIRDALSVFMERTDGTNAIPWWVRARWWHCGPYGLRPSRFNTSPLPGRLGSAAAAPDDRAGKLLPPSVTGVIPGLPTSDKESVYVTTNRQDAITFGLRHAHPMLYEVTFSEEPQPDDTHSSESSFRVPEATIRRVETISRTELDAAIRFLTS